MSRSHSIVRLAAGALLAMLGFLVFARPAAADDWRILARVQGRVESLEPGGSWAPIFRSRRLADGAKAKTGADAVATVTLSDQSSFRLGPNTEVEMTKFQLTPEGKIVVFQLIAGKVQADVAKLFGKQSRFEVRTPNGVLAARGTEFSATVMKESELHKLMNEPGLKPGQEDQDVTLVRVFEGSVKASFGSAKFIMLSPGDNAILGRESAQLNPANFPGGQVIPSNRAIPNPRTVVTERAANDFQDPTHRNSVTDSFNRQYDNALSQYDQSTQFSNNNAMGSSTTGGTPPLFNPSNTTNPLNNTFSSSSPGGSSGGSFIPPPGGGTSTGPSVTPPTGRLIIIIR